MIRQILKGTISALALMSLSAMAHAQAEKTIKIGVLTDQSSLWSILSGSGSVAAARMAVQDAGGNAGGFKIEVVAADHQNNPDTGVAIARRWLDQENVDIIVDLPASPVAVAVQGLAKERGKITLVSSGGSKDLTGKYCSPTGAQWVYNTYATSNTAARAATQAGGTSWYFVTVDYTFGHQLEAVAKAAIAALGGTVTGSTRHPLNAPDFSTPLLQAAASGAKVLGLATGGGDTANALKQAAEFRIRQNGIQLVALNVWLNDIHSAGLETAQGIRFVDGWYWDRDDDSRAFAKRFMQSEKYMPSMTHAGVYSSVAHYLKAVAATSSKDGVTVMKKMREIPVNDLFTKNAHLREDGQLMHDMLFVEAKSPADSKYSWDYEKIISVIPAAEAFGPPDPACALIKQN